MSRQLQIVKDELELEDVALLLGVSERMIRNYITSNAMPCTGEGKTRRFKWDSVREWFANYRRELQGGIVSGVESYDEALARKTRAEADLKELQLAQARGEVAPIADVERVMSASALAVQTQMLALPSLMAPEILGMQDIGMCVRRLTGYVEQALTNVAKAEDVLNASIENGKDSE